MDAKRLGIIGFSAGGHLVSSIATHNQLGDPAAADLLARESSRPNFAILCYPVITMTEPWGHGGSKRNLLGENPDPKLAEFLSSDKQVSTNTPPCFLWHTTEDTAVQLKTLWPFIGHAWLARSRLRCTFSSTARTDWASARSVPPLRHGLTFC